MKAFFVGLIFLIAVSVLVGIGILFYPLIIVWGFFLRLILALIFIVFCIWLLGKFIIFVWEGISKGRFKKIKKIF